MIKNSCLYISDYIEKNKDIYYDLLTSIKKSLANIKEGTIKKLLIVY